MSVVSNSKKICLVAVGLILAVMATFAVASCSKSNGAADSHPGADGSNSGSERSATDSKQTSIGASDAYDTVSIALFPAEDALPMLYANEWGVFDSMGIRVNFLVYRSQMDAEQAIMKGKANVGMSDMFRIVRMQNQKKPVGWLFSTQRQLFLIPNKALRISKVSQLGDHMIASSRFSMDDYFLSRALAGNVEKKKADGTLSSAPIHVQVNSLPLRLSMLFSHQVDAAVFNAFQTRKAIEKGYRPLHIKQSIDDGFGGYACNSLWAAGHVKQLRRIVKAYDIAADRLGTEDSLPPLNNAPAILAFSPGKPFAVGRVKHAPVSEVLNWLRAQNGINSAYKPDTLIVNNELL